MLRVDVYRHSEDDNGKLIEWFTWKPGNKNAKMYVAKHIRKDVRERWFAEMKSVGIFGEFIKVNKLSDGKKFMEQLQYQYKTFTAMAGAPYETKNGEHIRYPDLNKNVETVEVGTSFKKAEREKKRLQDDGFSASIRRTDNPPYEYRVIGVKVGKKK